MTTGEELRELIFATALARIPLGGGIAEVERSSQSVLVYGAQPRGLRGVYHPPTCVQLAVTDAGVRAIILGGRPGIPVNAELFALTLQGYSPQEVAEDALNRVGTYLAESTS